jgi:tRNA threonylcarbamoyl adenosine modification protein (Sua5/YciO/YrdC/YwlC family)
LTLVIDLDDPGADLAPLVEALLAGRLAVLPTDTVAGLACAAALPDACARVAETKGRDPGQAAAVICPSIESLVTRVLPELEDGIRRQADALLPGPLTIVVPNPARRYPWLCGADPSRIGLRVPVLDPALAGALERVGGVCASSANRHGEPDPVTVEAVPAALREAAAVVVRGGPVPAGRPSTVVDLSGPRPVVLREGAVPSRTVLARLRSGAAAVESAADDDPAP